MVVVISSVIVSFLLLAPYVHLLQLILVIIHCSVHLVLYTCVVAANGVDYSCVCPAGATGERCNQSELISMMT